MRRDGFPYQADIASAVAERKRENKDFLASGDGMSSSLQAGYQLASGEKSSSAKCSEHAAMLAVTEK